MLHFSRYRLLAVGALLVGWAPAFSNDYYVDAWTGFDGNGGTSPADARLSVTHALASVPDPAPNRVHTIHLAPAIYDASTGEVYPLRMRPRVQIVGDGGPIGVILQRGWSGPLIRYESLQSGLGESFDAQSLLARVPLHQGGTGVSLVTDWGELSPRIEDVLVWQMLGDGVSVAGGDLGAAGPFNPVLERVEVWDNDVALRISMSGEGGTSSVSLVDCVLRDGPGHGLDLSNGSDGGHLVLNGLRTIVRNSTGDAVHVGYTNGSSVWVDLRYCELVQNADDGLEVVADPGLGGVATTRLGTRGVPWAVVPTDPATPGLSQFTIPNVSALVGQTFSFQALSSAPAGGATPSVLTHPVSFSILP
jgi:hypothetical protein